MRTHSFLKTTSMHIASAGQAGELAYPRPAPLPIVAAAALPEPEAHP